MKLHPAPALWLACALAAQSALAQPLGKVADYEAEGYVGMDRLTTPLLHYAHTGKVFDGQVLLDGAGSILPKEIARTYARVRSSRDEFTNRELSAELDAFVEGKTARVREARGFLYELDAKLLEYDFARQGFPMDLKLAVKVYKSERSYHCLGAHGKSGKPWHGLLTACVAATNLHSDPAFRFLPMPDTDKARFLREKRNARELTFLAVAVPDGSYRVMRDQSLRFGGLGETKVITGIQPTRMVGLLVVDARNGDILEIVRAQAGGQPGPAAQAAKSAPPGRPEQPEQLPQSGQTGKAEPTAGPAQGTSFATPTPGPTETDVEEPGRPQPAPDPIARKDTIQVGMPQDMATQQLDLLLSLLSLTVYTSPEKIAATQGQLQELQARYERIRDDEARLSLIQKKELQKLAAKLEATQRKLELLQSLEDQKQEIPAVHGARRLASVAARKVHHERWQLRDGRQVLVFRGTDNLQDIETDLQLAVNPDTVAEITANLRNGVGRSMLTGLQGVIPGSGDAQAAGRPEAFLSADALVGAVVRSGVPPARMILTGHSLGGGLAQYAGFRHGVGTIVTFNTAPLSSALRRDAGAPAAAAQLRHYVAFVAGPGGDPLVDPVSQKLADFSSLPEVQSLQVVGRQHAIEVCNDLDGPEFTSFMNTAQGAITKGTVMAIGAGKTAIKVGAAAVGAQAGAVNASTDRLSSAATGAKMASFGATAVKAGVNCLRHPFLCSAAAATGGVVSAVARDKLTRLWSAFSAHRMKNMYEAMLRGGVGSCGAEAPGGR
jgi:pimeloyl-ACP methyl ester carboxylesterase